MKTCRFCMHEQESGDYCEACGSPLSADRPDFSDSGDVKPEEFGGFPDPASLPDETQSFPDPTLPQQPAVEPQAAVPAPVVPLNTQNNEENSAQELKGENAAAQPQEAAVQDKPEEAPAQDKPSAESSSDEKDPTRNDGVRLHNREIMYSAKELGETVYLKSRGSKLKATANYYQGSNSAASSGNDSGPTRAYPKTNAPSKVLDSGISSLVTTTWILNIIFLAFCCGSTIIAFILALLARGKVKKIKNYSADNPEESAKTAKNLAIASLIVLGCTLLLDFIAVLLA